MKIDIDPIKLLIELKRQGMAEPDNLSKFAKSRLNKINAAFYSNFNADTFTQNILSATQTVVDGKSNELPMIAGIPVTDFITYGCKRMSEMGGQDKDAALQQLVERQLSLLQLGDLAIMPSSIAIAPSGIDNTLYVPTFGELAFNSFAERTSRSLKDHASMITPLVERLSEIDEEFGANSTHLAILGLKLSKGNVSSLEMFSEQACLSATQYLLENNINSLKDKVVLALIDSAKELDLPLEALTVRGVVPLGEYLTHSGKEELRDKYEVANMRQQSLNLIKSQEHRVSHDYDPMAYFDI